MALQFTARQRAALMPRGGSKSGERRGGRAKGTPNKTMLVRVDRAAAEGRLPQAR